MEEAPVSIALSDRFRYPPEFVQRVQTECPDDVQLINLLKIGSIFSVEQALKEEYPMLFQEFQHIWDIRKIEAGFCLVD
jgi:hypothetical protein